MCAPVPAQRKAEVVTKKRKVAPPKPVEAPPPIAAPPSPHEPLEPMLAGMEEVGTGLLDRLDALQRVAASAPGGPLLIVAGPGTGKTRTLTHRIAYLLATDRAPAREILAPTFSVRAAGQLRLRLAELLGEQTARGVLAATFHSNLGRIPSRFRSDRWPIDPLRRIAAPPDAGVPYWRQALGAKS